MAQGKYNIDMCHGPLLGKIILFSLPLIFSNMLQLIFNAADMVVIGHFAAADSMAAVGATMNLNSLIISLYIGLSVGSNVLAAQAIGAGEFCQLEKIVQTTMTLAVRGGGVLMILAMATAKAALTAMGTPEEILPKSLLYFIICLAGMPMQAFYNFGSALLRAAGDTRRPFFYLVIAGVVNVLLNLLFVIVFHMDVAGVAAATAISHAIAAILIGRAMSVRGEMICFRFNKQKIELPILREILKIGVPSGIQGCCFSFSNIIIQSSINSFGAIVVAGNTAALLWEGMVYVGSLAYHHTAISFVAQNYGARKYRRMISSIRQCVWCSSIICTVTGVAFLLCGKQLIGLLSSSAEIYPSAFTRMKILFATYALCAIMDAVSGALRGLGYSMLSAVNSIMGACVFRIFWVAVIFPHFHTLPGLYISYPISWFLVAAGSSLCLVLICRKLLAQHVKDHGHFHSLRSAG